jgi:hypothetical protein
VQGKIETVPYPPRDVHFIRATASTVLLGWKPPMLDGGTPIYEYEITFAKKRSTKVRVWGLSTE